MNTSEFVEIIRETVCEAAIRSTLSNLEHPPGRRPRESLITQSQWYLHLDEYQRSIVQGIVRSSAEHAVFGFLCVIDGVRPVESTQEKGSLELRFEKGGTDEVISPSNSFLYELSNAS